MNDDTDQSIEAILKTELAGKSVLMLEDELVFAMPIADALYRFGVESVQHVQRGEIAVREGTARAYDVLLFDRNNPGLDGLDALRAIRASGTGSHHAPALIITGLMNNEAQRSHGLLTGADDYVDKQVGPLEIMARIVNCMSRANAQGRVAKAAPSSEPHVIQNGPIRIVKTERRAYFSGDFLNLGTQAFDMLLALMESPGKPFTRSMLFEIASPHWKDKSLPDGYEHIVHKAVGRLREVLEPCEKILPPALRPLVVTLRGQGYLLRDLRSHFAEPAS